MVIGYIEPLYLLWSFCEALHIKYCYWALCLDTKWCIFGIHKSPVNPKDPPKTSSPEYKLIKSCLQISMSPGLIFKISRYMISLQCRRNYQGYSIEQLFENVSMSQHQGHYSCFFNVKSFGDFKVLSVIAISATKMNGTLIGRR